MHLGDELFVAPRMAEIWSGAAFVRAMLAFEAALARAEAAAHVIPPDAAAAISAACSVASFDAPAIFHEAAIAGTPAIPLVRLLTERVAGEHGAYVHWGATSQDVVDTALVLQMRAGLDGLVQRLIDIGTVCASLAERHRRTLMAGRTLLQQALPIPFGLKAARWLALSTRQARHLAELRARISVVQFGGAAGTLAALGPDGTRVTELIAAELGLAVPDLPWHTERDRVAEVAAGVGVLAGAMAKIAGDLVLLAQTEIGEVAEARVPGKGGSSSLPQKHNPVDAVMALAAARLAIGGVPVMLVSMIQEHERAAGGWQTEWEALPSLFCFTSGAVERVHAALAGLDVDAERMRANLDISGGLIMAESLTMALAAHVGKPQAQQIAREAVARATSTSVTLQQAALDDERVRTILAPDALARVLDPAAYLGSSDVFIDRALKDFHILQTQGIPHD
ncbi:MAG TPA: 3-carboxy-cis,cis-muconate cycloisomerase [Ktedonobacterales bacterium]|nr:3-carboxy-cis,cis-muconate cycloisomerase [Ktedonobacterales bacterium]